MPGQCINSLGRFHSAMELRGCSGEREHPGGSQHFFLGHHHDIEFYSDSAYCIDAGPYHIELHACHHKQGKQFFRYDLETQQIFSGSSKEKCLELDKGPKTIIIATKCDANNIKQKWKWGHVNEENLRDWKNKGAKIL